MHEKPRVCCDLFLLPKRILSLQLPGGLPPNEKTTDAMVLIAQISDLHLVAEGTRCYGAVDTNALALRAVEAVNRLQTRPDAVIVTGDIIDTAREQEYKIARDILERLQMPFFLLSGNHDDTPGMKRVFAGHAFVASGSPDRLYYATDIGTVRLIALDSSVPGASHGEISPAQLEFLDRELVASQGRPAVVAVHHPPIPTGNRWMDAIGLSAPSAFADVVARHGNVSRILCGHSHRTIIGDFAGTTVAIAASTGHQLELSLDGDDTFGFNLEPPNFLLHRWTESCGMTTQTALVDRFPGPYPFVWDDGGDRPKSR